MVSTASMAGLVPMPPQMAIYGMTKAAVIALSRRKPPGVDVRHIALDLTDTGACRGAAAALRDVTHLVYAALFELPGLVEGWRDDHVMPARAIASTPR